MKKFETTIVFGESATHLLEEEEGVTKSEIDKWGTVQEYSFDTQAELDAFIYGVNETCGWMEFAFVEKRRNKYYMI